MIFPAPALQVADRCQCDGAAFSSSLKTFNPKTTPFLTKSHRGVKVTRERDEARGNLWGLW